MVDPFDVFDSGRMAVLTDPTGACCCASGSSARTWGRGVVNSRAASPGNELSTTDVDQAKSFYADLFGDLRRCRHGGDALYDDPHRDRMNGGIRPLGDQGKQMVPPDGNGCPTSSPPTSTAAPPGRTVGGTVMVGRCRSSGKQDRGLTRSTGAGVRALRGRRRGLTRLQRVHHDGEARSRPGGRCGVRRLRTRSRIVPVPIPNLRSKLPTVRSPVEEVEVVPDRDQAEDVSHDRDEPAR